MHFGHGFADAESEAAALVDAAYRSAKPAETLEVALARRIDDRVPLAYIIGECVFWGRTFEVTPGVMIPRSPIGGLISDAFVPWLRRTPRRILDLCCGGGCLGALAAETFADARVDLIDLDPRAVALARRNTAAFGDRVRVFESDLFDALADERYDVVICNPPYVGRTEMRDVPSEYRHEPDTGLVSGDDGLDLWRRIVPALDRRLQPDGLLVGEVGNGAALFERAFPALMPIWIDLPWAEPQADGTFGVFVHSP